jgi:hypothetical protein
MDEIFLDLMHLLYHMVLHQSVSNILLRVHPVSSEVAAIHVAHTS